MIKYLLAFIVFSSVSALAAGPRARVVSIVDPFKIGVSERMDVPDSDNGYSDTNAKTVRTRVINTGIRNLVLLLFGQSNCTAIALTSFTPTNSSAVDNFNIFNGQNYAAADPLLGSALANLAGNGSIGGRVADLLITNNKFDRVILVPFCIGGTSIAKWSYPASITSPLGNNATVAMARLAQAGITPGMTNVTFAALWMQGESNHGTSQSSYAASFLTISTQLFATGFNGRIFVNKQTWIAGAVDTNVQNAQFTSIPTNTTPGTWQGANADSLTSGSRQADNTHFNDAGMASLATLIVAAMAASGAPF